MKTLTAFVVLLVGLTASAQTPSLQASDVDFESLISMHSVAEKIVMQAFNGGACHVTPVSDLPVAVRSIFGALHCQ
jgi:flagellar basal body rod protein FlgB